MRLQIHFGAGIYLDFFEFKSPQQVYAFRIFFGKYLETLHGLELFQTRELVQKALWSSKVKYGQNHTVSDDTRESMELLFYRMLDAIENLPDEHWEVGMY